MRAKIGRRYAVVTTSMALAAALALPPAPAGAAASETCHYEPVSCACRIVVTVLRELTGDPWTCA